MINVERENGSSQKISMKKRNYIKNVEKGPVLKDCCASISAAASRYPVFRKRFFLLFLMGIAIIPVILAMTTKCGIKEVDVSDSILASLNSAPVSAVTTQKTVITIPNGIVKSNPFVPYRDVIKSNQAKVSDVPAFNLVEPPEAVNENSDAARVMDTIVSGILYDKYSPSAILNIEGSDYLVKKGDVVNNYKVMEIAQDSVTVKLGANVYKAGIGEILTEGNLNHNNVSNLNNKFGGERR